MRTTLALRVLGTALVLVVTGTRITAAQFGSGYVTVTPDGWTAPLRLPNSGPYTADFTVTNIGSQPDSLSIYCGGLVNVTCTGVSQNILGLAPGASTTITATYTVAGAGSGEINLTAHSDLFPGWDEGYYTVPVGPPPPPSNWDVAPLNQDDQALRRCAAECFAAIYAQSTVPYISLDVPRNVTLVYHGDRVWPKPFIHLNVQKPSSSTPDTIFLQVKKGAAFQAFVNGETLLKFTAAASGWQRIGGQLQDSTLATSMYDIDLVVTWHYPDGSTTVQTWTTKLLVVNETKAPIARGWTLAGIQRVYGQADGSVLLTEGDGSAVFFRKRDLTTFFTPLGEFSTLLVNGTGWKRLYPDSTKVYFNSAGRMTDVYDRFNNRAQLFYDGGNRLTTIRDPNLQDLVLAYGAYGLSSIRDNISPFRYTNLTVPSDSSLTAIQDPDGVSTTFQYDGSRRLWKITDRRGNTTTIAYQVISGKVTGKLAAVTAPAVPVYTGGTAPPVVTYSPWHTVGIPYTSTASSPAAIVIPDTVYGRVTDPGMHLARFTVNRWGQAVATIDPLGDTTRVTYDANGLPIRAVLSADPAAVDTAAYNVNGLPTYVRRPGGVATTITYHTTWVSQPTSVVTAGLPSRTLYIGTGGRVDSARTGPTYIERYTYDMRGRVLTVKNALGVQVLSTGYGGTNGNRSADTRPVGSVTYGYDPYGRNTTVSRTGLATRTTAYDVLNRPDSVLDGVNPTATRFMYDNGSNVLTLRDPASQVYGFAYNALGWMTARTDPLGKADTLKYDIEGQPRQWKNRRGQTTRYSYDVLHRPTGKGGTNTDSTTLAYSVNRRQVTAQSRAANTVTATDVVYLSMLGLVDTAVTNFGAFSRTRRYGYTAAGLLDSVWVAPFTGSTFLGRKYFPNPDQGTVDEIRIGGKSSRAAFDAMLRDTLMVYPSADTVTREYVAWGPPAAMQPHEPSQNVLGRSLEYDGVGRIRHQFGEPTPIQRSRLFGYDGLGRVKADSTGSVGFDECYLDPVRGWVCPDLVVDSVRTFTYDVVGNVLRDSIYRVWNGTTAVTTGTYGIGNRMMSFAGCTYQTDDDGNVVSRTYGSEAVTFWWSSENRLDSLAVNGTKTRFWYDGVGRLVKRDANGTIRYFWWDGGNLYAELDAGGVKLNEYSYYGGLDNPHAVATADSTVYFTYRDGLGSVIGLVDQDGTVAQRYGGYSTYGLWGEGWTAGPLPAGTVNRARFKGALWMGDGGPELYYMRARWYEPRTGRFLSEDPIGLAGGLNLYLFAGNDAVNGSDPTGRCLTLCSALIGAGVGGLVGGLASITKGLWTQGHVDWGQVGRDALTGAIAGGIIGSGVGIAAWVTATPAQLAVPLATQIAGQLTKAGGQLVTRVASGVIGGAVGETVGPPNSRGPDAFGGGREANTGGGSCWIVHREYYSSLTRFTDGGDPLIDTRVDYWLCPDGRTFLSVFRA
jgi:RHS repeat-associated protein